MLRWITCLIVLMTLAACGQKATPTPAVGTPAPYLAPAPTPTPGPTTVAPAVTGISQPSPTPASYSVVQGDTLSGIAQRNGVTLDALLAANPGISPSALVVGTRLVIPGGSQATGEPSPTPAAAQVEQARCWPETSGGLWCFGVLQNNYAETLENLSAEFSLVDGSGQESASQAAFGLLNILPPGKAMPLAVHFAAPVQAGVRLSVQVLTAIRLTPGDRRYLPVELENSLVTLEASGRSAEVSGRVRLSGAGTAKTVWLLATAYDAAGEVVGVRRWESSGALTAEAALPFDFAVFSAGPEIARVEFLAEARP